MSIFSREKILYEFNSPHGFYQVVEKIYSSRPSIVLYSGKVRTAQSAIPLDHKPEMVFHYNQRFIEIFEQLKPTKVLIIGGGVYTLPSKMAEIKPQIQIDIVEPDSSLDQVSKEYFKFKPTVNLNIYHLDGLSFLKSNKTKYDLVIVDAFIEDKIPDQIISDEFAKLLARTLSNDGVLAVNIISTFKPGSVVHKIEDAYSKHFKNISVYLSDTDAIEYYHDQNLILVASQKSIDLRLKYRQVAAS